MSTFEIIGIASLAFLIVFFALIASGVVKINFKIMSGRGDA